MPSTAWSTMATTGARVRSETRATAGKKTPSAAIAK